MEVLHPISCISMETKTCVDTVLLTLFRETVLVHSYAGKPLKFESHVLVTMKK